MMRGPAPFLPWPQLALLAIWTLGLGIGMEQHGKARTGNHNFWIGLLAVAIEFTLLKFGGFFG